MSLRKQVAKDANKIPSGNQQIGNMQEDDDGDNNDELSSSLLSPLLSRDKRRREKENKSKPKEMTEEEMMDLALRLSEQEASITALRQQKEEEAMMKAIQDSMDSQTQSCPSSQGLLDDAEASLRICSRRKLVYSNGKPISAIDQRASEDSCTPQTDLNRGAKRSGDSDTRGFLGLESHVSKKLRRKEGRPLLEMPDLSQTQKNDSQASPCSSDVPDLHLDSPQSSDSTQIEDCQLRKSPVFPLTGCRAEVRVPRLTQDLLQTCRTSGFVWCSQDSLTSSQKLLLAQPKSPTFPKSHKLSNNLSLLEGTASPKSPIFSETEQGEDGQTSPEYVRSPVFGRNTQHENSPSACKLQVGVCNSGFTFSSQESLASSLRSTTCQPKSPVFPRSPSLPSERSATCESPVYSETDEGQTEQSHGHCTSPASSRTGQRICLNVQKHSTSPSPAELRDSGGQGNSDTSEGPSQRPRQKQDSESDHNQNVLNKSSKSDDGKEELKETSKDRESEMTLIWSEEDDDVTPVGSPSPVFLEERPAHQADGQPASLDHVTAASPGTTVLSRPSSSSTSTDRQRLSNTQREPISSKEMVSRASAPPASTVHYYWGVPFCPRGLDPDDYTQVILAQMEVYEKSLKQAQRCLLRKAEWGEAVLPQPEKSPSSPESPAESPQHLFPQRRGLRLRSKKLCDTDDAPPAEADDKKEEEGERENKEEGKKNEGEGEGRVESDDCEICPETQLSDNDDYRTQNLMMDTDRGPEPRPKSPELLEVEMILQNDSPAEDEQQNEVEVEVDVDEDQKMKENTPVRSSDIRGQYARKEEVEEDGKVPGVMEIKDRGLQRSISPELELAIIPQNPETSIDCPICQGSFPVTEIEMHAAYCDGEVAFMDTRRTKAESYQASLKPRRKRTRKAEVTAEDPNDTSNPARNQEKCYICQKLVPLRDYSRHTELCIHRQASKTAARENLLSALEKTESRNSGAGPSGSKLQPGDVIDLRDDDDDDDDDCEEGSVPAIRISNSPIRSFTPISEATDCLIDFKKQYRTKKLSQRPR